MRNLSKIVVSITVVASASVATLCWPHAVQDRLGKPEALDTIRALNTAEVTQLMRNKTFVPLVAAIQSLKWESDLAIMHIKVPPESSRIELKDYELSIVISSDAKHYMVQLVPSKTAPDCAAGWFSDETGVIYSGPSLECIQ